MCIYIQIIYILYRRKICLYHTLICTRYDEFQARDMFNAYTSQPTKPAFVLNLIPTYR